MKLGVLPGAPGALAGALRPPSSGRLSARAPQRPAGIKAPRRACAPPYKMRYACAREVTVKARVHGAATEVDDPPRRPKVSMLPISAHIEASGPVKRTPLSGSQPSCVSGPALDIELRGRRGQLWVHASADGRLPRKRWRR